MAGRVARDPALQFAVAPQSKATPRSKAADGGAAGFTAGDREVQEERGEGLAAGLRGMSLAGSSTLAQLAGRANPSSPTIGAEAAEKLNYAELVREAAGGGGGAGERGGAGGGDDVENVFAPSALGGVEDEAPVGGGSGGGAGAGGAEIVMDECD
jgi:hypothetical protein